MKYPRECILRESESENWYSIRPLNSTGISVHKCGGALLTEIFGVSTASCMFDVTKFQSRAGEHNIIEIDGHEQL